MFYGQSGCVSFAFTGSVPANTETGFVSGSAGEYFYVKSELAEFAFEITSGSTSNAKLILGGGGGRSNAFNFNPLVTGDSSAGGGGAGEVLIQDVYLSPGLYFVSASSGGASGSYGQAISDGDDSVFIIRQDLPFIEQTTITARGGKQNDEQVAGANGNGNTGGLGIGSGTIAAGGGGGGSTQDGQDAYDTPGTPNSKTGGNGGTGSAIPAPFSDALGPSNHTIGTGGPGQGYGGQDGVYPSGLANTYSNGGMANGQSGGDGKRGLFALFIPKSGCITGGSESFATSSTLQGVCESAGNISLFYDFNTWNGLQIGTTLFNDKYLDNPVSDSYIISSSNEVFFISGSSGVISSQTICSTTVALSSGSDSTTACNEATENNYYHTGSFTAGTIVYSDFARTTTVPNNFYRNGINVSETTSGVLQTSAACSITCTNIQFTGGNDGGLVTFYNCLNEYQSTTVARLNTFNTCYNANLPVTVGGTATYTTSTPC
jgi:hypothetical protein